MYRSDEIGRDLIRIALNYPGVNIQPAVECLAHLSSHICHHTILMKFLTKKCFDAIVSIASVVSSDQLVGSVPEKDTFSVNQAQVILISYHIISCDVYVHIIALL